MILDDDISYRKRQIPPCQLPSKKGNLPTVTATVMECSRIKMGLFFVIDDHKDNHDFRCRILKSNSSQGSYRSALLWKYAALRLLHWTMTTSLKICSLGKFVVCTFPLEYCEFGSSFKRCKEWLHSEDVALYEKYYSEGSRPWYRSCRRWKDLMISVSRGFTSQTRYTKSWSTNKVRERCGREGSKGREKGRRCIEEENGSSSRAVDTV